MKRNKTMKILGILLMAILLVVLAKMLWVALMTRQVGSFGTERTDILRRRSYLLEKVAVEPQVLINSMPASVGPHFQGEWVGFTVFSKRSRHYLLADYVPVGEAITLAMRTAVPWTIYGESNK